jgi:macrolide transport system ATP-binding/permease protein
MLTLLLAALASLAFELHILRPFKETAMLGDVQYALRILRKTPGFTSVAVLSLALGIGVNSAMFSLADALLLRPLPVPSPSRVVTVCDSAPDQPIGTIGNISYPDYIDLRDKNKSFEGMTASIYTQVGIAEQRDALPQLRLAMTVSGNFFRVLGLDAVRGRTFSDDEDRVPGRDAVAVLSYDTWEQHFSADPKIIGRTVRLNDVEFTIIGVTPKKFTGIYPVVHPDLYIPMMMLSRVAPTADFNPLERRDHRNFTVKGRLKPGVSLAQANAELATIAGGLAAAYPDTNRNHGVRVRTEVQARVAQSPPNAALSGMLMAIAALVLIIACANVANLLLSRARSRSREMAVRLAIGASRGRLMRQLLTESLILSMAGAGLGLFIAQFGADYFNKFRFSSDLPISLNVQLDQRVLIFSLLAAVLSALVFGLAPALRSAKTDLVPALKTGETAAWHRKTLGRNALVIAQVALSLMLLSAATLFVRTLRSVLLGNPGFRTDHLMMMSFDPSLVHYSPEKSREFFRALTERARQLPGVKNAALAGMIPFDGSTLTTDNIAPEGFQFPKGKESDSVFFSSVDEQYFETMGTPIVRGRGIQATDIATAPLIAVVNEYMAQHYWPNQDPIGKRFRTLGHDAKWVQVVGVAKNATYVSIGEPRIPFLYVPFAQQPPTRMTLLVQTPADASAFAEPLRNLVRSIDPHQPIYNVRTMREHYQTQGLQALRLVVNLVGGMGLLGLSMALVGLYGLVAYSVSRRTREIGIRMAIGAGRLDILRIVLRQGMTLAIIGVGVGLAGSFGVAQLIRAAFSRLQENRAFDPWTFIVLPVALLAVTMLASYIPARRAAAIDPNQALHYE